MADFGLWVWDASANLVFDSTLAAGGVPVGFWSGGAGTVSFPQFAGLTMQYIVIDGAEWFEDGADAGVAITYPTGYPVATLQSWSPTVMLVVF